MPYFSIHINTLILGKGLLNRQILRMKKAELEIGKTETRSLESSFSWFSQQFSDSVMGVISYFHKPPTLPLLPFPLCTLSKFKIHGLILCYHPLLKSLWEPSSKVLTWLFNCWKQHWLGLQEQESHLSCLWHLGISIAHLWHLREPNLCVGMYGDKM